MTTISPLRMPLRVAVDQTSPVLQASPACRTLPARALVAAAQRPGAPLNETVVDIDNDDGHAPNVGTRETMARMTPRTHSISAVEWGPLNDKVRLASGCQIPGTRYEIVRWLGEGGMGVVFEALHVDLRRPVALKILKASGHDIDRDKDRFISEARAIAKIDSPYVVDVLDFGELPDGRPFYTMELLAPDNLHDALRDGPMSLARALPILRQCCKALHAAHSQGLAHRDIKPENVLLQREGGREDSVRLVDFGICAPFGSRPKVAGTAMYMAPEQIRGSEFDGRVDIYSLGCLAMEMLTGEPPFQASSALALINAHLDMPAPKLRSRRPEMSVALEALVHRCLSKQASERFADMIELEAALCEIQISAGIMTPWDDITLPGIEASAYESLAERMPNRRTRRPRNFVRRLQLAGGAFVIGVLTAIAGPLASVDADTPEVEAAAFADFAAFEAEVEALTSQARKAGSQAYWAYPSEADPEAPTALASVISLESLDGAARPLGTYRALQLRDEFAQTLVRLGDRYWEHPQGELFAAEFYTQALMFDPDHAQARERVGLSSSQIAVLEARLARGEHTAFDRELGSTLCVLSETDDERRRVRAEALLDGAGDRPSSMRVYAGLAEVVGAGEPDASSDAGMSPREAEPELVLDDGDEVVLGAVSSESVMTAPSKADSKAQRRARARSLSADGERALAMGRRDHALALFQSALANDRNHTPARAGLARVYFARGDYDKAFGAAKRAAEQAPKDDDIQLLLGDASLKSDRIDVARGAYRAAARLGSRKAKRRLEQLEGKAG